MDITKDEIIDAGVEYTLVHNPMCICGGAFGDAMRQFNRNRSFEAGAEWALRRMNGRAPEEIAKEA